MNAKNKSEEGALEETTKSSVISPRLKFPHWRRLRSSLDFARVYAGKVRAGDDHLLVFADRNTTGKTRIGLSVSKKNGNSIVRHRMRRLVREAYRLAQHHIPEGLDLICITRPNSDSNVEDYQNSLIKLSQRLEKRLPAKEV